MSHHADYESEVCTYQRGLPWQNWENEKISEGKERGDVWYLEMAAPEHGNAIEGLGQAV